MTREAFYVGRIETLEDALETFHRLEEYLARASGNCDGPGKQVVDTEVAVFDNISGKKIKGGHGVKIDSSGNVTGAASLEVSGTMTGSPNTVSLTIASGVVTLPSHTYPGVWKVKLDTENGDPTDDLDTVSGGVEGDIVILHTTDNARDVTVKDATGDMQIAGDMTLDTIADTITLVRYRSAEWSEISRSNNA